MTISGATATATTTSSSRSASRRDVPDAGALAQALEPVCEALLASARRRAEDVRCAATEYVRNELSKAHAEAERIVGEARTRGIDAGEWIALSRLSAARREAHEAVLAARRRAFEQLRRETIEALVDRASTPEGRMLSDRLRVLMGERMGSDALVNTETSAAFEMTAESGNRRASIGPETLVDQVLSTMTPAIEELWR